MMNFDDAAVTASSAQLEQTAPTPSKCVTAAASHPALVLPLLQTPPARQRLFAQQPVQEPPGHTAQTGAPRRLGRAEMHAAREQMTQWGVRVSGIHGDMRSPQRSQTAGGLNLRSRFLRSRFLRPRFAGPAGPMEGFMKGASDALEDGGLDSAGFRERGESQAGIPEKVLNR